MFLSCGLGFQCTICNVSTFGFVVVVVVVVMPMVVVAISLVRRLTSEKVHIVIVHAKETVLKVIKYRCTCSS